MPPAGDLSAMHIDHIGIATDDVAELADLYGTLFDAPVVHEEEFDGLLARVGQQRRVRLQLPAREVA